MPGYSVSEFIFTGGASWTKYICPKCDLLLRDAVQPSCGHWMCQTCAEKLFDIPGGSPRCPKHECNELLSAEDGINYFPDRFVRREILNYNVVCIHQDEGCTWEGKFAGYEKHVSEECKYNTQPCKHCGQQLSSSELTCHEETCSLAAQLCPLAEFGCHDKRMMNKEEMEEHVGSKGGLVVHLIMLIELLKCVMKQFHSQSNDPMPAIPQKSWGDVETDSGNKLKSPKKPRVVKDGDEDETDSGSNWKPKRGPRMVTDGDEDIGHKAFTDIHAVVGDGAGVGIGLDAMFGPHLDVKLQSLLQQFRDEFERSVKGDLAKKDEEIATLKASMTKLEKQLRTKNSEIEDRDFRLSLIENSCYDGNMIWKIPQFSQRRTDAENGKYTSIFSLPFYTNRYGYKMCLRLYILGDGIGKNTHMSLFFVIMRGEFDSILQWPFTHKVTFKLISQTGGRDIVDAFQPDPMSSSFKKPKSDMNIASGCPRFVSHQDLKNGGFIKDDTIFIKCTVDQSTIRHP